MRWHKVTPGEGVATAVGKVATTMGRLAYSELERSGAKTLCGLPHLFRERFGAKAAFQVWEVTYLIIVADAADSVSVNFSNRCKFLQI